MYSVIWMDLHAHLRADCQISARIYIRHQRSFARATYACAIWRTRAGRACNFCARSWLRHCSSAFYRALSWRARVACLYEMRRIFLGKHWALLTVRKPRDRRRGMETVLVKRLAMNVSGLINVGEVWARILKLIRDRFVFIYIFQSKRNSLLYIILFRLPVFVCQIWIKFIERFDILYVYDIGFQWMIYEQSL